MILETKVSNTLNKRSNTNHKNHTASLFQIITSFIFPFLIASIPSTSHALALSSPSITHKSQAFRSQFISEEKSLTHTWPFILQSDSKSTSIQFTSTNHFANPEPLINTARGTGNLQFFAATSTANTLLHLQLQITDASSTSSNTNTQNESLEANFDGSLAGITIGNWLVSIGAVDRWWGPAWQSPLLMSNNARPIPSLSLDRIEANAPTTYGFRWIGPWQVNTFLGQLESDRVISNPLFWGFRISAMPINGFEIAIGRTALFGGGDRDVDSRVFYNVITGNDNADDQPGNQLGSLDMSYRFNSTWGQSQQGHEIYIEIVGEDEAGGAPTKKFSTIGYTGFFYKDTQSKSQGAWHYLLEYSDTTAGSFNDDEISNVTYEHHIYQSGYTHYGQTIGSPLGGDTQGITIGLWLDQSMGVLERPGLERRKNKNTGAWMSRKTFADEGQVFQLSLWTEQPCGILHCTLSLEGFDQPMKDQRIDIQGKKFAISAGVEWFFDMASQF